MAVPAQFSGLAAGVPAACAPCRGAMMLAGEEVALVREMQGYAAYNCFAVASGGAQSELTCIGGGGGGGGVVAVAGRKRGREKERYAPCSSAMLPIPGMVEKVVLSPSPAMDAAAESAFASALVSKSCIQHDAEIDALVRVECERLRAGLEQARKRQCLALARAAAAEATRRLRDKEAELVVARRRSAELEERLRQAAAESQAWRGLALSNEAAAAGLSATLDHVLLRAAAQPPTEGFGDFDPVAAADANSCCFDAAEKEGAAGGSPAGRWACKRCGEREASVLLLPCRHLCLCKACEPRLEACPVCLAAKTASVVALSPAEAW